jgi:hypothetical protein
MKGKSKALKAPSIAAANMAAVLKIKTRFFLAWSNPDLILD